MTENAVRSSEEQAIIYHENGYVMAYIKAWLIYKGVKLPSTVSEWIASDMHHILVQS